MANCGSDTTTDLWVEQPDGVGAQRSFGMDAVLYFNYLYPFFGVAREDVTPTSSRTLVE